MPKKAHGHENISVHILSGDFICIAIDMVFKQYNRHDL